LIKPMKNSESNQSYHVTVSLISILIVIIIDEFVSIFIIFNNKIKLGLDGLI
jgi:hypothetical protein